MDGAQTTAFSGGGAGAGGGPAPFLLKTYDMVDDSSTDHIVSWSPARTSFIVWNPPEFSRLLLPTYFKHNNFSSFIRQLNTYGFHKIDPERWEFANEDFVKDRRNLLKNIHRRKPIHSHSHPQVDPERAALDEETDKLSREKAELQFKVKRVQQEKSTEMLRLDELKKHLNSMKERQDNLLTLLEKAIGDPLVLEHLVHKIDSVDFTAYYKKRRLPQPNHFEPVAENNSAENQSTSRTDFVNIFPHDLTNKLRLELSPVVFDRNRVLSSTQSSDEGLGCSPTKLAEVEPRHLQMKPCSLQFAAEAMDLTDTGTSLTFQMDSALSLNVATEANSELQSLQQGAMSEECDGHVSCQLNLTLASFSPFQADPGQIPARVNQISEEGIGFSDVRSNASGKSPDHGALSKNKNYADDAGNLSSSQGSPSDKQGPTTAPVRVNDVFWEQFLTERPGSSENEEASSSYRAIPFDEKEDKGGSQGMSKTAKNLGNLSL